MMLEVRSSFVRFLEQGNDNVLTSGLNLTEILNHFFSKMILNKTLGKYPFKHLTVFSLIVGRFLDFE